MNASNMNPIITSLNHDVEAAIVYSEGERIERRALGLPPSEPSPPNILKKLPKGRRPVKKKAICAPEVLNEAIEYGGAFTRGLRVDLPGGITHLLISGTASVSENGDTLYPGDFRAQCWRTFHNVAKLLESEGATWEDVVRTTCYLRDIERDYVQFNNVRTEFYNALGLDPYPASTGVQAHICRSDLLVEIEALAIIVR
jgi:enamine deaminase RidA (YjgF/YER057c/UK114 family)